MLVCAGLPLLSLDHSKKTMFDSINADDDTMTLHCAEFLLWLLDSFPDLKSDILKHIQLDALYRHSKLMPLAIDHTHLLRAPKDPFLFLDKNYAAVETLKLLKVVLDLGYDPNSRDGHKRTALHRCQIPTGVPILVEHGADPEANDCFGIKPLRYALQNVFYEEDLLKRRDTTLEAYPFLHPSLHGTLIGELMAVCRNGEHYDAIEKCYTYLHRSPTFRIARRLDESISPR